MRYDIIQELGRRMCGKTVVSVEAPHADEAVALFVMSDGSRVRLHATELGAWVEDTKVGELYESLDMLMRDYGHHRSHIGHDYGYQTPEPLVSFSDGVLELEAPDGRKFRGLVAKFKDEDQRIVHHHDGFRVLATCSEQGDLWTVYLHHEEYPDICPPELTRSRSPIGLGINE